MDITLRVNEERTRTFQAALGALLLVYRERAPMKPILGVYDLISSQSIDRVLGRSYLRTSLVLSPACILEPRAKIYGKDLPRISFKPDLSFSLGKEIYDIFVGKEAILQRFRSVESFAVYAELFSHLPEHGPYERAQFSF
mgnify:CR=1 FL=1